MPADLLTTLADRILFAKKDLPLRVAIDGIDAAGKTTLADRLAQRLTERGCAVLRASIDGYHNPRAVRYQRGPSSPEGYYYDSFNLDLLQERLLRPLGPGGSRCCWLAAFDYTTDSETSTPEIVATDAHILLFDGVFLLRPALYPYWDFKIFVEIDFETSLARALVRDLGLFGSPEEVIRRYREKYIPGQQLYLAAVQPAAKADVVIDNRNLATWPG